MRLSFKTDTVAVFDDIFSTDQADKIFEGLSHEEKFAFVQSGIADKVYSLNDGNFLQADGYLADEIGIGKCAQPNSTISTVIEMIRDKSSDFSSFVGDKGKDWKTFSARAFCFPRGTGLTWHDDGKKRSGAYIYYAHREWDASWGGELLLAARPSPEIDKKYSDLYGKSKPEIFSRKRESTYLMETGFGHFISPRPNRLIVFSSGIYHQVKRVDEAAGNNIRMTVAGFFLK